MYELLAALQFWPRVYHSQGMGAHLNMACSAALSEARVAEGVSSSSSSRRSDWSAGTWQALAGTY